MQSVEPWRRDEREGEDVATIKSKDERGILAPAKPRSFTCSEKKTVAAPLPPEIHTAHFIDHLLLSLVIVFRFHLPLSFFAPQTLLLSPHLPGMDSAVISMHQRKMKILLMAVSVSHPSPEIRYPPSSPVTEAMLSLPGERLSSNERLHVRRESAILAAC